MFKITIPDPAPMSRAEKESFEILGCDAYRTIMQGQIAATEGRDPDYIADCYDAIYWSWVIIAKRLGRRGELNYPEERRIYRLAAHPVEHIMAMFDEATVHGEGEFIGFFIEVYRQYRAFHRPWYKNPKWQVWNWGVKFREVKARPKVQWPTGPANFNAWNAIPNECSPKEPS